MSLSMMSFGFVLTTLVLTSHVLPFKLSDDSEHSGDYDLSINTFGIEVEKVEQEQQSKIDDDILMKLFSNVQQKTPNVSKKKTDLQGDFNDFIDLLPTDELKEKIAEYYRNDMDIQHISEYMSSKEFYELRKHFLDTHDVKELLQFLNRKGINVKNLLRMVDHRLGISKIRSQPTQSATESNQQFLGK